MSAGPPLRSLHVITSDARRGAETFAVELSEALEDLGHAPRVVALSRSGNARAHPTPPLGSSRRAPGTLMALRTAARRADVVVAHGSSTLEACVIALAGTGTPLVSRVIGELSYWVCRGPQKAAYKALVRRPNRHVVLWGGAAAQLLKDFGVVRDRIDVIPNAVDVRRFARVTPAGRQQERERLGVPNGQPCLACVGALSPEKDVAAAITALADLPQGHLLIAGDGPMRQALEAHANLIARGRVTFMGVTDRPAEVYAAADLLLLPSHSEGMPGVIIEAGLAGTPTLAAAVGSIPEMLEDGVTGFVTAPGDPALLAARIRESLPRASQVGAEAAATFVKRYTMAQVAPMWASTLERAVRS